MREYLQQQDIPENQIYYDSLSYDTITNWQEAMKITNQQNFKSAIIVSSTLHIYRISALVEQDKVYYAPYKFEIKTFNDIKWLFNNIHYEWASWLVWSLPKPWYESLVRWIRNT